MVDLRQDLGKLGSSFCFLFSFDDTNRHIGFFFLLNTCNFVGLFGSWCIKKRLNLFKFWSWGTLNFGKGFLFFPWCHYLKKYKNWQQAHNKGSEECFVYACYFFCLSFSIFSFSFLSFLFLYLLRLRHGSLGYRRVKKET